MFAKIRRNNLSYHRAKYLLESDTRHLSTSMEAKSRNDTNTEEYANKLDILFEQSKTTVSRVVFVLLSVSIGAIFASAISLVLIPQAVPFYFILGAITPYLTLHKRANKRAMSFLQDYPSVLLATSSSVRAGLTSTDALERAVALLPEGSLCRLETKKLISDLNSGTPKEEALARYGKSIRLPELDLFRSAFLMVLESGGKFAPTLKRLAEVSTDGAIMMTEAEVATASMRMTGNALLLIIPLLLGILCLNNENYWDLLLNHSVGQIASSIGIVVITTGYSTLRIMSNFKP